MDFGLYRLSRRILEALEATELLVCLVFFPAMLFTSFPTRVVGKKVSVSDIVNNLTTNVANKPLSAAQGVVLARRIETVRQITDEIERELTDKLAADELPEAIENALAQAKESGEFDGAAGPQGNPGPAGADGPPGADYVLTDADRQEIAKIAAGLGEVPGGGGDTVTTLMEATVEEDVADYKLPAITEEQVERIKNAKNVFFYARVLNSNPCTFGIYYPRHYRYTEEFAKAVSSGLGSNAYPEFIGYYHNWGNGVWIAQTGVSTDGIRDIMSVKYKHRGLQVYADSYVRLQCTTTDGVIPAGSTITVKVVE